MASVTITKTAKKDVKFLKVEAGVRYWEDGRINGVEDEDGSLVPLRKGDCWCPVIDVDQGQIVDWPNGVIAELHYKVCDEGSYTLTDELDAALIRRNGYVPSSLSPGGNGYGDYIIMKIDGDGLIENWRADLSYFEGEE